MSKNDRLAPIVRALVDVPQERLGVLFDIINNVGGIHGECWYERLNLLACEGIKPTSLSVYIRRSLDVYYPKWVHEVMHPELEFTGPTEYSLDTLDFCLHDTQKNGDGMRGYDLYEYLKKNKMLKSCLSLRDGEEIRHKGQDVFQKLFTGKALLLWKSAVKYSHPAGFGLRVPYLYQMCLFQDRWSIELDWRDLDDTLGSNYMTPCFPG